MSATDPAPEPERRRVTSHRVAVAVMIAVMLAGAAVLLLPYSTEVDLDIGTSELFQADGPIHAQCEPPLLDAMHGESDDWLNYAPGEGGLDQDGMLSGTWCSPESLQRGAIGAGIVVFGMCGLLLLEVLRQRRLRLARRAAETESAPETEP